MNNSMNDLMDLISVLCGGYCLYTWFRLVREKKLFMSSVLLTASRPTASTKRATLKQSARSSAFWGW